MRSMFIALSTSLLLAVALAGCQSSEPPPAAPVAAEAPAAQPNVLQTQMDALQKAKDVQAEVDEAEKQRQAELDKMTGG